MMTLMGSTLTGVMPLGFTMMAFTIVLNNIGLENRAEFFLYG
ncbi:hypothetical protein [Vibrio sp. S11_S32]|nr:hypothetical protein [Vibrio sp. S11_S32]